MHDQHTQVKTWYNHKLSRHIVHIEEALVALEAEQLKKEYQ
jgi:hypothetical protein